MVYISLRLIQVNLTSNPQHWSAAVNCFLLASVLSWLRLMSVFPVSSTFVCFFYNFFIIAELYSMLILIRVHCSSFLLGYLTIW